MIFRKSWTSLFLFVIMQNNLPREDARSLEQVSNYPPNTSCRPYLQRSRPVLRASYSGPCPHRSEPAPPTEVEVAASEDGGSEEGEPPDLFVLL